MAFIFDPFPPEPSLTPNANAVPSSRNTQANGAVLSLIQEQTVGTIKREVLTWRTPHLGYVRMYINPQQLTIGSRKDISTTRTKGGFIIQYAGESLTDINIEGTTGSGGIDGINILESIYRAEQEAFEGIALALEERLSVLQSNTLTGLNQLSSVIPDLFLVATDTLRNFGRPQPTLASLAANIEMFFQGATYRGYFENFSVVERAGSPGLFDYTIKFVSYAKQGLRRNFMPWHRQPLNPADNQANGLTFPEIADEAGNIITIPPPGQPGNPLGNDPGDPKKLSTSTLPGKRNTSTSVNDNGSNITDRDLRIKN